ncbi:MAG: hypothetical protein ACRDGQ_10915, partial [Candidatus Limnocylindrales bacterium]
MADQLTLRLESDSAGWPTVLRPMLAQLVAEPFDDPDTLFEPWWGGERTLAYTGRDPLPGPVGLRLIGADEVILTDRVPELAGLPGRLAARSAILDGTLVAVDP